MLSGANVNVVDEQWKQFNPVERKHIQIMYPYNYKYSTFLNMHIIFERLFIILLNSAHKII